MPMEENLEMNYSEGKQHGDAVTWFENGKMRSEEYYRFGIIRAAKYWNNKGEPANSLEEAEGGFNLDQTSNRKGLIYLKDSDSPYTGKLFEFHANSLKKEETNYKKGKEDGKSVLSGMKTGIRNWKSTTRMVNLDNCRRRCAGSNG